jgi:CheY-like chemotaxis protein
MATALVVDDSTVDRRLVGKLLQKQVGLKVKYAKDGKAAVQSLQKDLPELVLTDLRMPRMNGLDLVEHIRREHPLVPVILMTAYGSDEIAVQALQKGAASYVPKRQLAEELAGTVESVLDVARTHRAERRMLECLTQVESRFQFDNDPGLIPPLISHLESGLRRMRLCDDTDMIRVAISIREAIINAMEHGNLEADSQLRERDDRSYRELLEERRKQKPYCERRVYLTARESRDEAVYAIRDEGRGFDPSILSDPTDPANLEKVSGRGLLLIRTFMDEVYHNNGGREITMIKRREQA